MKKSLLAFLIIIIFVMAGCVPPEETDIDEAIEHGGDYQEDVDAIKDESEDSKSDENVFSDENTDEEDRKMKILSIHKLQAETDNFEDDVNEIIKETHEAGGYIDSNESTDDDPKVKKGFMSSQLILSIPKSEVKSVVEKINNIVKVNSESLDSIDVTEKYYDIESRLDGLKVREERLRELYNTTENVDEIIKVDKELSEVEQEIEKELRNKVKVEDRIKFAKIEINLEEVKEISDLSNSTFKGELKNAYTVTLNRTLDTMSSVLSFIIKALPVVVVIVGAIFIFRKYLKDPLIKFFSYEDDEDDDNNK